MTPPAAATPEAGISLFTIFLRGNQFSSNISLAGLFI